MIRFLKSEGPHKIHIQSDSGAEYQFKWLQDRKIWHCNCPHSKFRGRGCKHIDQFMNGEMLIEQTKKDEFACL